MVTLKFYNKDNLELLLVKNYNDNFSVFETALNISPTENVMIPICMLRLLLPDAENLEELLNILKDKVIMEASDEGGILIRILCSFHNYKLELSNIAQQLIALNIHEKLYNLK